jgi:CheY-like chemotaxis protein
MAQASDKHILVVDDEPDVRNFLAACIEDAGFNVRIAVDGMDAMEKVKEKTPDLITLDMVMPRQSGIKFMREMRKHEEWADIPVIVITAHARDEFGTEDVKNFNTMLMRHRPKVMLEKPITPEKLVKAIGDILEVETGSEEGTSDEKSALLGMIQNADPKTLEDIRNMLMKKAA